MEDFVKLDREYIGLVLKRNNVVKRMFYKHLCVRNTSKEYTGLLLGK